ncbi:mRNA surveillance protein pelota [Candidatus Micrarchaeota archaeon]|nr:MAG: mRNA surveillance protein pelota [Candidatus Micrarchaeota archaeon]
MLILYRKDNQIKLRVQSLEDLWHLEKIIRKGDRVSSLTTRKFVADSGSQERKKLFIKIAVEKLSFHRDMSKLRILGSIVEARPEELAQIGQHHSIDIGVGDELTVEKDRWTNYELARLREAEKHGKREKLSVLTIDDSSAQLFHILGYGLKEAGEVHARGLRKYRQVSDKARQDYYNDIYQLISSVDKLIITGPGFEKDRFRKYLEEKGKATKIMFEKSSSTGKSAVAELINKGVIDKIMRDSRLVKENKAVEEFVSSLAKGRAIYGEKEVINALKSGAVAKLLILDELLFTHREKIDMLSELASRTGTELLFISRENEASEKVKAFGGIVGILRFSLSKS